MKNVMYTMNKKIGKISNLIGWRPNTKQCYYLFLLFLFVALLRDPIEHLIHPIAYVDELIALCAVPLFLSEHMGNRHKILFKREGYARYIITFLLIGMISSIVFSYQPFWKAALPDSFLCIKFWLAIYVGKVLFRNFSPKSYAKEIFSLIRVITWSFIILILVDYLIWIFNHGNGLFWGQIRYGIKSVQLFYSHSTIFAACCTFLIVVLTTICGDIKGSGKYLFVLGVMSVLTLRSKALGTAIIAALLYVVVYLWNKRLNPKILAFCLGILLIIGGKQIYYYFFSNIQEDSARYQLVVKSVQIALDHFPLGAGFATFGSYISGEVYSPLYERYHISKIWGLERGEANYVSDNFWPMILGQTGWIGLFAYSLAVIFLFLRMQKLYKIRKEFYLSGLIALGYLLIASVAESAFVNPTAIPFAVWIGVLLKAEEGNVSVLEDRSSNGGEAYAG